MSFAIDANILLYASDEASPFHRRASEFLVKCASDGRVFYLAWATLMSYVRISTHPRIFAQPLSPHEAMQNVEALLQLPHVRVLAEQEDFWDVYREVAEGHAVRGNLVPDAHLAALLRQHGVTTLYTNDVDFRRFDFLEVRDPFKG